MTVLSAPSTNHENRVLHVVIAAVAIISAIGAGWILLSFTLFKPLRSFRHQLILGLAISDFWMAINFLSSALMNLSGLATGIENQKLFCSFNGFMIQVFVVQTDYWVLAIAVCTYLILSDHKHQSTWIQEHRIVIWLLPWFFSILWAALGLGIVGYGYIGAWCWFTSDRIRLFVNFIPRWLIIIIILGLYIRLYFLIHKAHNRFISFDEDAVENLQPGFSTGRNRPNTSFNIFSSRDNDYETGRIRTMHTRIGQTSPILKRISYQMMAYPLVYMIIWTVPTTIRIYQATTNKAAPFAIGTVDKSCIVIQGFADAVVYGFNEHTWNMWREIFNKSNPFK
ncbi:G protein-coupled glucose receptor regulating Gpa2-domain-containing protein [Bisporella sp. PMI_857]|nr:G protein-coupled glucose receptor regulating Gpa2-domain-containing protein [Bisporella sp. PMI_857]